jgi:hypothetical protein
LYISCKLYCRCVVIYVSFIIYMLISYYFDLFCIQKVVLPIMDLLNVKQMQNCNWSFLRAIWVMTCRYFSPRTIRRHGIFGTDVSSVLEALIVPYLPSLWGNLEEPSQITFVLKCRTNHWRGTFSNGGTGRVISVVKYGRESSGACLGLVVGIFDGEFSFLLAMGVKVVLMSIIAIRCSPFLVNDVSRNNHTIFSEC